MDGQETRQDDPSARLQPRAKTIFPIVIIIMFLMVITLLTLITGLLIGERARPISQTIYVVVTSIPSASNEIIPTSLNKTDAPGLASAATPLVPVSKTLINPSVSLCPSTTDLADRESTPTLSKTSALRFTPTMVQIATRSSPSNGTPPLPKAMTATPLPPKLVDITLDNGKATDLAREQLANQSIPIRDVIVTITKDCLILNGQVQVPSLIPNTPYSSGVVAVTAKPRVVDEHLQVLVFSIKLDGNEVGTYREQIESAINDVFDHWLRGYRVQSYTLKEGELVVEAYAPQ